MTILSLLLSQTVGFVWWAATLTAMVKQHARDLRDHEQRLREAKL